ncbi:MAG: Rap1a/Tai family immunity protein [Gammaproteobacteria bacterium]
MLLVSASVFATPSGKDLLAACEHSLDKGFSGAEGMMCAWYVTPCDCFHSDDSEIPRVCLPPDPDVDALAQEVMEGLIKSPDLLGESADVAAGMILKKIYPCTE